MEKVEFEQVVDEKTGETIYRMKPAVGKDGKVYELVTDPTTGSKFQNYSTHLFQT